jgi:dTDP-4-amino-4,6-dideoxygalactose transaminase
VIFCSYPLAQTRHRREAIQAAVARVIESESYILGREVADFEADLALSVGAAEAIGVGNGTDALVLSLRALGIGPGDEVVTVSFTALATVAAVVMAGATPVLVDVDAVTRTIDIAKVEAALSPQTKAIIAVHLYGQPCALDELLALAQARKIALVEDCAQAQGAEFRGRQVGSLGTLGCCSFYPTKNLGALGDGGAVVTSDPDLAARVRRLRQYGWDARRISVEPGMNSRLDPLQAAVLGVKLPYLVEDNARRQAIAAQYTTALSDLPLVLPRDHGPAVSAYHLYVVETQDRDGLVAHLGKRGIAAGIHYAFPAHLNPGYTALVRLPSGGLPVTERLAGEVLSLPMYPELSDSEVAHVIDATRDFFGERSGR